MKIIGVIQARMNSQRLPGKVMMSLLGRPVLWHIYNRLKYCKNLDQIVISTGEYSNNKEIIDYATRTQIPFFEGSEKDLIDRLYKTALHFKASAIIRITADCPLIDPFVVDDLIKTHFDNQQYDIITNCKIRTFPHGLDVELYTIDSLKTMWTEIRQPEIREWFPFFIEKNPSLFKVYNVKNDKNLSHLRWTLDYPEDYRLITKIYDSLFKEGNIFTTKDILELYEKDPQLEQINSKYSGYHNIGAPNI